MLKKFIEKETKNESSICLFVSIYFAGRRILNKKEGSPKLKAS